MGTNDQEFLRKSFFARQAHEERLKEPLNEKIAARDIEADKERMRAFDHDADNPATVAKFQELQQRFEDGGITISEREQKMEEFNREQSQKAEREQASAQRGTPSQELNAHIARTQQPSSNDRTENPSDKLQQHIEGRGEAPKDREAAKRALDEHIDRGGAGGGDRGDIRQQFRDTGREVTGLDNGPPGGPKRPDLER